MKTAVVTLGNVSLIFTVIFLVGYLRWFGSVNPEYFRNTFNDSTRNMAVQSNDMSLLYELANDTTWIAEKQYFSQRQFELNNPTNDIFQSFAANYPCIWGESFAWNNKTAHFWPDHPMDGGKWLCGVQFLQKPCIVYSIGCNRNFLFEYAYGLSDKCAIYTFDPVEKAQPSESDMEQLKLLPNFKFYPWEVSDVNKYKKNKYRLSKIMSLLNHTHIDILKIDIEGFEYRVFHSLDKLNEWPSIGQIQIEIHTERSRMHKRAFGKIKNSTNTKIDNNKQRLRDIIELFEKHNFRIFHVEPNGLWQDTLAEYALIQKDWRPHIKNYK